MGQLILVRHTSVAVPQGICYGQSDVALADTFELEAQIVKDKLSELSPLGNPRVYCSPLSRCRHLANYCGYTDMIIDERLLELNFGAWEMKAWDTIDDPHLQIWYDDYIYTAPRGGESFAEQCERVASFLADVEEDTKLSSTDTIVFTHGGVLRAAMIWAGYYSLDNAFDYECSYGKVEVIKKNLICVRSL